MFFRICPIYGIKACQTNNNKDIIKIIVIITNQYLVTIVKVKQKSNIKEVIRVLQLYYLNLIILMLVMRMLMLVMHMLMLVMRMLMLMWLRIRGSIMGMMGWCSRASRVFWGMGGILRYWVVYWVLIDSIRKI